MPGRSPETQRDTTPPDTKLLDPREAYEYTKGIYRPYDRVNNVPPPEATHMIDVLALGAEPDRTNLWWRGVRIVGMTTLRTYFYGESIPVNRLAWERARDATPYDHDLVFVRDSSGAGREYARAMSDEMTARCIVVSSLQGLDTDVEQFYRDHGVEHFATDLATERAVVAALEGLPVVPREPREDIYIAHQPDMPFDSPGWSAAPGSTSGREFGHWDGGGEFGHWG